MNLHLLDTQAPQFPNPRHAAEEPDGLLAVGGNLAPTTLIDAYRQGIFPWFGDDDPILWWSPATRCVIRPQHYHISKSLLKCLRRHPYQITTDKAFDRVIEASPHPDLKWAWRYPALG
jgi:leucyl/phenylalanyl-tRNA--protein transferase